MKPLIEILRLKPDIDKDIPMPRYMTHGSAGMDICAAVKESIVIKPKETAMIPTGFAFAIPEGFEAQIRPRSGIAVKYGIGIINSPGTIDSDYRGEVKIALINMSDKNYVVERGDRIAQMVIKRVWHAKLMPVEELEKTDRNSGGFGHTGMQGV